MCQRWTGVLSVRATSSALPVRGPPVAAVAPHLLGGDELREAPADVAARVLSRHLVVVGAVRPDDPHRTAGDVGDLTPRRVRPRVDDRLQRGEPAHPGAGQIGDVERAGEPERSDRDRAVGRVPDHAAGALPGPLATCPLLRGQLLGTGEHVAWVGDDPLGHGVRTDVGDPEQRGAVGARRGAQEHHAGAVRGDGHVARGPEGEPLGAGGQAREGLGAHERNPIRTRWAIVALTCWKIRPGCLSSGHDTTSTWQEGTRRPVGR